MKKFVSLALAILITLPMLFSCGGRVLTMPSSGNSSPVTDSSAPPTDSSTPSMDSSAPPTDSSAPSTDSSITDGTEDADSFENMSVFDKAFYVLESDPGVHLRVSSDSELSMSTIYQGSPLSIKVATRTVQISKIYGIIYMNGADMLFTVPGSTMTLTFREGFINGKAFEYNGQNGLGAGYYKKMTSDEYADKLAKKQEEEGTPEHFGITKENCVTVSYKQDSYGNHVATFTDISGEALEYFRSLLKAFEPFISPSSLSNINLTYTTTEDFIPLRAEVRFMFSGSGSLHNMVTMKADYLVGSSVEDPVIDLSGFIETDTLPSEEEDTEGDSSSDGGIVA